MPPLETPRGAPACPAGDTGSHRVPQGDGLGEHWGYRSGVGRVSVRQIGRYTMAKTALSLLNDTISKLEAKNTQRNIFLHDTRALVTDKVTKIVENYAEHGQALHKGFTCFGGAGQNITNMRGYHSIVYRNQIGELRFSFMISNKYTPIVDLIMPGHDYRLWCGSRLIYPFCDSAESMAQVPNVRRFFDAFNMEEFEQLANATLEEVVKKYA